MSLKPFAQSLQIHKNLIITFFIISIWILFFIRAYFYLDPDFGWHLKLGSLIVKSGISYKDPFSYTMPSYPFIDHEWLSNILIDVSYSVLGMVGPALIYSLLPIIIFFIFLREHTFWKLWTTLFSVSILLPFFGIRTQVVSWFFAFLLIEIGNNDKLWLKYRKFLPILFLFWANLHGSFFIGILIISIYILSRSIHEQKIKIFDIGIILMSSLVTLINPYGLNLWHEVYMQLSDPYLRSTISEWLPVTTNFNPAIRYPIIIYAIFSAIIVVFLSLKKKITIFQFIIFSLFFVMGFFSRRNIPLWVLVSLDTVAIGSKYFFSSVIEPTGKRGKLFCIIFIILISIVFFTSIKTTIISTYSSIEDFQYPKNAIPFIKKLHHTGHIFSAYGWGGYLIWKLPNQKVFIDGRMPSWRWKSPNINESDWAFLDFRKIISGDKNYRPFFKKYNIDIVVWPTHFFENKMKRSNVAEISLNLNNNDELIKELENDKWKKIYQDYVTVIYQRPNTLK